MAVFKCKMCSGALKIEGHHSIVTCEYCGTQQTIPRLDDDRRVNLYERANHFRRNNEFDKAMAIYETILNEDNTEAEAYWSIVLCRYGIEYVEDPETRKRVPTVNRTQFTSIFDDDNYKSALKYADAQQRALYEREAAEINKIQRGILAISQREEPFDVFICYKETDAQGRRTRDSVLAQELYHELTEEGFKVFFSRITLEDKLGVAYEPYIFAALNSAKVMVVLGTKPDHFNAVWVKNEWSRYLALVKESGGEKVLIPAYRDMDPYDLPEEFSHLQAQDMSKLGFMQDLTRGVAKLVAADGDTSVVARTVGGHTDPTPLLKRVFIFLTDGNFTQADEYCEKVLDIDPECGEAYLGKLMVEQEIRRREDLAHDTTRLSNSIYYDKIMLYGSEELKTEVEAADEKIREAILEASRNKAYNTALDMMRRGKYEQAISILNSLGEYRDAPSKIEECKETIRKIAMDEQIARERREAEAERKKKHRRKMTWITLASAVAFVMVMIIVFSAIAPSCKVNALKEEYGEDLVIASASDYPYLKVTAEGLLSCRTGYTIPEEIVLPDVIGTQMILEIGSFAFSQCKGLKKITLPRHITSIGTSAFSDCTALTNILIPDSVVEIDAFAFSGCRSLKTATIGKAVQTIGRYAFYNCNTLTSVTFKNKYGWYTNGETLTLGTASENAEKIKNATVEWNCKS